MTESSFNGIKFTDTDIVNLDNFIGKGEYNPHNIHPFLLHDHGFVVCVVFASCLQDALDEAVDENKMDRYLIAHPGNTPGAIAGNAEIFDYVHTVDDGGFELGDDGKRYEFNDSVCFLGNASEPFDIESLGVEEMPNPSRSFCALFNAMKRD